MKRFEKMLSIAAIAFLLFALMPVPGVCGDEEGSKNVIKKSWDVGKGGTLKLSSCGGSIKARGSGDKLNLTISIDKIKPYSDNAMKIIEKAIETEKTGNDVRVKVDCDLLNDNFKNVSMSFDAELPKDYNADLNTGGGSVSVSSMNGNCKVNTGGGSVKVSDMKSETIRVNTGGGSVEVKSISTGEVSVNTGGGSIDISDTAKAVNVKANTGGGSITVEAVKGDTKVNTGGGSIEVKSSDGKLHANTGGGSISVAMAKGTTELNTGGGSIEINKVEGSLSANTGGGGIKAEVVKLTKDDSVRLGSGGGDIHLYLSGDLPVTFDLKIEDNDDNEISSDFPLKIEGNNHSDEIIGTGEINGGGALVKIRTSDSNIYIHKIQK
jgi:hypothetical protein